MTTIINEYIDSDLNVASDYYDLDRQLAFEQVMEKNTHGTWFVPEEYSSLVKIVRQFWDENSHDTDKFAGIYRKTIENLLATIDFIHTLDVSQFKEDRWIVTDLVWRMYLMLYCIVLYNNRYIYDNVRLWVGDADILVNTTYWFLRQHDITYVSHDDESEILNIDYFVDDDENETDIFDLREQNRYKDVYAQNCDYSFNMITYEDCIDWVPSKIVSDMRDRVDRLMQNRFYDHYFDLIDVVEQLYSRVRERIFTDELIAIYGQPWIYEDYLWRANLMIYSLFVYNGPLTKEFNNAFHADALKLIHAFEDYVDYVAKAYERKISNN